MNKIIFRSKKPEGLEYIPNFINSDEERYLLEEIRNLNWQEVKLFDKIAKRKVFHYGLDYTYDTRTVKPTIKPPLYLDFLLKRSANLLKINPEDLAEILVTYYPIDAGIGWHRDAPVFDKVLGLSLLNYCELRLRKRQDHKEQYRIGLEPCSAYILSHSVRWQWEHRIFPLKEERYSITLRTLRR